MQVKSRSILLVIAKAEPGFWPRLLEQKGRSASNIKIDWSKVCPGIQPFGSTRETLELHV